MNLEDSVKMCSKQELEGMAISLLKNNASFLSMNANIPKQIQQYLSTLDVITRGNLAGNRKTSIEILEILCKDKEYNVRISVARNDNATIDILKILSNDDRKEVRMIVAEHNIPEIILKLSKDKEKHVLMSIAQNPNCPKDILDELSNNLTIIRECVAENLNTAIETLEILSKDKVNEVRKAVAKNLKCPLDILIELSNDKNNYVSFCAKHKLLK